MTATGWLSAEEQAVRREVRGWRRAEARHRCARAACLQAYAEGAGPGAAELCAKLEALDKKRGAWQDASQRFTAPDAGDAPDAGLGGPVAYGRWRRRWHQLGQQELQGQQELFSPLHPRLRAFLKDIGAAVEAEMGARPARPTDKQESTRRQSGLLTVVLRLPRLDRVLTLTETQEDLQRYCRWRSERIKEGRARMKSERARPTT